MARFDVHEDRSGSAPYLLDVQSDHIGLLQTCVVIPLLDAAHLTPVVPRIHLPARVESKALLIAVNMLASVPRTQLGPVVASLADRRHEISAAIDFLLDGF